MTRQQKKTMGIDDTGLTWRDALVKACSDSGLAHAVVKALEAFLRTDTELLTRDVNERTITGRLSEHLSRQFPRWDVDCEYNRDGHEIKRANGKIVIPDIIVHRRGSNENFLVIEVKKSNTFEPDSGDLAKLQAFKSSALAYQNALFLKFSLDPPGVKRVRWV